ncbi:hypothetical protein GCM10010358_81510 [Streptomyces minutiscleroticus]|uniref:Uncharacterized protein n=1 Tax=Streptomyces minutiscleroticus TaxID=68238 RepID=A0A918P3D8_9ACTN|nr:hypothetical protein [Streptomyces minutiscleroticus]GGY17885.1 hypothetical protein GCM10010358_81510 [Streptomyces minutiscleroticus]
MTSYDAQARYCRKLTTSSSKEWIGYRNHQTETCDEGPHVIVHVATRPAPEQDIDALEQIHQGLARQGFADLSTSSTPDTSLLQSIDVAARTHYMVRTGPVRADPRAREHPGFTKADFTPDWEACTLTCPRNVTSHPWKATQDGGHERLSVSPRQLADAGQRVGVTALRDARAGCGCQSVEEIICQWIE